MAPMPSDFDAPRRLHPISVIFKVARAVKIYALPALALFFGGGVSDGGQWWRVVGAIAFLPAVAEAVTEYLTYRYIYAPDELVVRWGLFFKNERHIPYARIQNIDARRNLVHSLFGVYSVAIETGAGAGAEASLEVLPESALNEMRRHVFAKRDAARAEGAAAAGGVPVEATPEIATDVLLRLGPRELVICGLVRGRGLLLLGAIVGLFAELGLDDAMADRVENGQAAGPIRRFLEMIVERASLEWFVIAALALFFVFLLAALRLMSVIYTFQKLWGFILVHSGGELRMTYGSFTRVKATIPLRRVQAVSVREGPLHRMFKMTSVRADTAGGVAAYEAAGIREWLAPIIPRAAMPDFVRTLLPAASLDTIAWQPAHPRAARRASFRHVVIALVLSIPVVWYFGPRGLAFMPPAIAIAVVLGIKEAASLGHAIDGDLFYFKSGWFWRQMTIAPLYKVQAVSLSESPFDRRHGMASLVVDTAGARGAPHRLDVPFLDRAAAGALAGTIAGRAAGSALSW